MAQIIPPPLEVTDSDAASATGTSVITARKFPIALAGTLPNLLPTPLSNAVVSSTNGVQKTVKDWFATVDGLSTSQSSGSLSYDTLSSLTSNLVPVDGTTAQVVNDTVNNGFYVKSGATNTGSWVKKSSATIPALDVRAATLESAIGVTNGTDNALVFGDAYGFYLGKVGMDGSWQIGGLTLGTTGNTSQLKGPDGTILAQSSTNGTASIFGGITVAAAPNSSFAITDASGFIIADAATDGSSWRLGGWSFNPASSGNAQMKGPDGSVLLEGTTIGTLKLAGAEFVQSSRTDIVYGVVDAYGFIGPSYTSNGKTISSTLYSQDEILARDASARAYSDGLKSQLNTTTARLYWLYNLVMSYGQSLSVGVQGFPSLSRTAKYGNLMMGNSVRPIAASSSTWTPVGSSVFNPLIATVSGTGGAILNSSQEAALDPVTATNAGETVLEGSLNFFKLLWNLDKSVVNDSSHLMVAAACGVGGQSIGQLSKGASPDLYSRTVNCATLAKSIADGLSSSMGIPYFIWMQGEQDYALGTDKATYKAALLTLVNNLRADIQTGIFNQTSPFGFITYQVGGGFSSDTNGLAPAMAQLELSNEQPDWFLAAPVYPVVDKQGAHLTSNGYRWLSKQFGKVMFRLAKGEIWKPVQPIQVTCRGNEILASFHVPAPPLKFGNPYSSFTALDYADKGFTVIDDSGTVGISSVQIVSPRVIRITTTRNPTGTVIMRYADKTYHNGNGCVMDSDATFADDVYSYTANSGQDTGENISALVGNPYPLNNWCVAGQWSVTLEV